MPLTETSHSTGNVHVQVCNCHLQGLSIDAQKVSMPVTTYWPLEVIIAYSYAYLSIYRVRVNTSQ